MREPGGRSEPARQVAQAYLIALSRLPTDEEIAIGCQALERLTRQWKQAGQGESARLQALTSFCHALVNSAAFLFVD